MENVEIVDLNYLGNEETIPVYLFTHKNGLAVVDCGPASTLAVLEKSLQKRGYKYEDITDVLITHIHLDHSGAAGFFARKGAKIHVHPKGVKHLVNPEKLIDSAKRIYGDKMDYLWGEILPVTEEKIHAVEDGEEIMIGDLHFTAFHTPGHAVHHIAYLWDGVCFSGDVGGSRLPGQEWISLPMPPPDLHIETWLETVKKLRLLRFKVIAPTHFGFFEDVQWHLDQLERSLIEVEAWLCNVMKDDPSPEALHEQYMAWCKQKMNEYPMSETLRQHYDAANPAWMSPAGLYRYWHKYRMEV